MTTDWLDDVLQQRPVDDDGFTARVVRLTGTQRRTTVLRAIVLAVVFVLLVPGSWLVAGWMGANAIERIGWSDDPAIEAGPWLDAHRAQFRSALARLDKNPALVRRTGADAGPLLDELQRTGDTALFAQLGSFAVWTKTAQTDPWALLALAKTHLTTAMEAPLVDGEPAPFATAARDVEALGRLWLTNNGAGHEVFAAVAAATTKARARQRDGGFVPAVDDEDVAAVFAVWMMADTFASPAATDEDLAFLRSAQSVLTCNVVRHAEQDRQYAGFLDERLILRRAGFAQEGCGTRLHTMEPCGVDDDVTEATVCVAIAIAKASPWRRMVHDQQYTVPSTVNALLNQLPAEAQ